MDRESREQGSLPDQPSALERSPQGRASRSREKTILDRGRAGWGLTERERAAVLDIGSFRTVAAQDLSNHRYQGRSSEMNGDLESLIARGLVQKRTALTARGREKLVVCVLTKAGRAAAKRLNKQPGQEVYAGFVKPAEAAHDAAIYRMFHAEAARIIAQGGKIDRVVLDYEIKREVFRPLAKLRSQFAKDHARLGAQEKAPRAETVTPETRSTTPALRMTNAERAAYAKKQAEVARANGLKVVKGKIPLPDLRIEYTNARGESTKIDLELATRHYHGSHLAMKAEAGFQVYMDGSSGGSRVHEERELTAQILAV